MEKAEVFIDRFVRSNFKAPIRTSAGMGKRIEFIDLAKGVCILLVVMFHAGSSMIDFPGLSALRMPLYFILSGLFFKDYGGFFGLLEKKVNKILIPFLSFFTIDYIRCAIVERSWYLEYWLSPINNPHAMWNSPIWFLATLFMCNMLFFIFTRISEKWFMVGLMVIVCGVIGYLLTSKGIFLPFYLTQAFNGIPFFYVGWLTKRTSLLYPNHLDKYNLLFASLLIGGSVALCNYVGATPHIGFYDNVFRGYVWMIHFVSIAMVIGTLLLCKSIRWLPVISYLGRYSIVILCIHKPIIDCLHVILIKRGCYTWVEGPALFLIAILICWLAIPFFIEFAPKIVAQKDLVTIPKVLKN